MYVLTPSFWLVARVPLHHSSPFPTPSMFLSLWWAVCCVIFVVGFLYMYVHTCTYKIVISMRPIPPTQFTDAPRVGHSSVFTHTYVHRYLCMCLRLPSQFSLWRN